MNTIRSGRGKQHKLFLLLVLVQTLLLTAQAFAQEPLHARVSYEDGKALIRGTSDADWSYATINTLVLPGDTLWADQGGLIELEMAGGTYLRLADGSKAEIVSLPPSGLIKGWSGSFYLQRVSRSTGSFFFDTPACKIEVDRDTHVRIDVVDQGATTITVRWGRATVRTDLGAPVSVSGGRRAFCDPGFLPSAPVPYDRGEMDGFDTWSADRAKLLAVGVSMPASVTPSYSSPAIGYNDLGSYGEWVYVGGNPYWRPTVVVNYVPYRYGYWSYTPACGYVWVGDYPFCYYTSHYGYWTYYSGYGWVWGYTGQWRPSYAFTVRCGDYFLWAPYDRYGVPVYLGGAYFDVGGVRIGITASSYAPVSAVFGGYPYTYGQTVVQAVDDGFIANINIGEVNIWNTWGNGPLPAYLTRLGSTAPVRDYNPPRAIRGVTDSPRTGPARDRAVTLEIAQGRESFRTVSATGQRGLRTPMSASSRTAQPRTVSVDPAPSRSRVTTPDTAPRQDTRPEVARRTSEESPAVGGISAGGLRTFRSSETGGGPTAKPPTDISRGSAAVSRERAGEPESRRLAETTPSRTYTSPLVSPRAAETAPSRTHATSGEADMGRSRVIDKPQSTPSSSAEPQRTPVHAAPRSIAFESRESGSGRSAAAPQRTTRLMDQPRTSAPTFETRTPSSMGISSRAAETGDGAVSRGAATRTPAGSGAPVSESRFSTPVRTPAATEPQRTPTRDAAPRTIALPQTSSSSSIRSFGAPRPGAPAPSHPTAPPASVPEVSRSISPPRMSSPAPSRPIQAPSISRPAPQVSAPSPSIGGISRPSSGGSALGSGLLSGERSSSAPGASIRSGISAPSRSSAIHSGGPSRGSSFGRGR